MELRVNSDALTEVMAYDNMINAFMERLLSAVKDNNQNLLSHYEREIRQATRAKSLLFSRIRNEDHAPIYLVQ